jgi:hypothetical protein
MKNLLLVGIVSLFLLGSLLNANAIPITDSNDSALNGATVIDFESEALGSYSSLNFADVTITGDGNLTISNDGNGIYTPPADQFLDNRYGNGDFYFDFTSNVSAFGLQIGAVNFTQTLSAFDSGGNLIESVTIFNQSPSFVGYYGIASLSDNIGSFSLSSGSDWVVLDNLSYVGGGAPVPEPSTMLLFGAGLAGLVGYTRRKNK